MAENHTKAAYIAVTGSAYRLVAILFCTLFFTILQVFSYISAEVSVLELYLLGFVEALLQRLFLGVAVG